jgi:hypothetical protein
MSKKPITIDAYTGEWQAACRPTAPRVGALFRMADSPDAREWDDFKRCLHAAGRGCDFVRYMPRLNLDVMRVVAVKP